MLLGLAAARWAAELRVTAQVQVQVQV